MLIVCCREEMEQVVKSIHDHHLLLIRTYSVIWVAKMGIKFHFLHLKNTTLIHFEPKLTLTISAMCSVW